MEFIILCVHNISILKIELSLFLLFYIENMQCTIMIKLFYFSLHCTLGLCTNRELPMPALAAFN